MRDREETAPDHRDPALRTRVYHAELETVLAAFDAAAGETGWRDVATDRAGTDAVFRAGARSRFPPARDALTCRATALDGAGVRVEGAVEVSSLLPTLGRPARRLRAFLWAVDARVPQARDTPLRKKGL